MIVSFYKWGRTIFLSLFIFSLLQNIVIANEQSDIEQATGEVNIIGKILLDKKTNEFYFYFTDNNHALAYPVLIRNRKTLEQLKKFNKKWVRVIGKKNG